MLTMQRLAEIERAAEQLSGAEQTELLYFLALRLEEANLTLPDPREFSAEPLQKWMATDEAAMRRSMAGSWAKVLLTLDTGDFGGVMETGFYHLSVMRPGPFLERERAAGRLK